MTAARDAGKGVAGGPQKREVGGDNVEVRGRSGLRLSPGRALHPVQDHEKDHVHLGLPLSMGRSTSQGWWQPSWPHWPSRPQKRALTPLKGSGGLSSAGCVMTRPGFAVFTARSSSSDRSPSSTEVRLQPWTRDEGCVGWEGRGVPVGVGGVGGATGARWQQVASQGLLEAGEGGRALGAKSLGSKRVLAHWPRPWPRVPDHRWTFGLAECPGKGWARALEAVSPGTVVTQGTLGGALLQGRGEAPRCPPQPGLERCVPTPFLHLRVCRRHPGDCRAAHRWVTMGSDSWQPLRSRVVSAGLCRIRATRCWRASGGPGCCSLGDGLSSGAAGRGGAPPPKSLPDPASPECLHPAPGPSQALAQHTQTLLAEPVAEQAQLGQGGGLPQGLGQVVAGRVWESAAGQPGVREHRVGLGPPAATRHPSRANRPPPGAEALSGGVLAARQAPGTRRHTSVRRSPRRPLPPLRGISTRLSL